MPLPTSNLSFSAIQTEFGGSNPISLSEYYKSGTYVRANSTGSIPTSGAISLSQFLGTTQGVIYPGAGTILSQGCVAYGVSPYTYRVTRANGSGGSYNEDTPNSTSCGYVAPPVYGTILSQGCVAYGVAPYTYRVTKADGSGGSFNEDTPNSPSCGYSPPVPTATWSTGYSNNGTAGPISTFVAVNLTSAALSTVTFSFSGVVVENGVAYSVPNVTISAGQTSGSANTFSGVYNGSGPYVGITLRATVTSAPYTITNGTTINTAFSYSA